MALRQRTIKHPGFEFYENVNSNYRPYIQNSTALAIGYFAKGPVAEPITLTSIEELTTIFGKPRNDAEYYSYKGAQNVLNKARAITVIRIPYDNTLNTIGKFKKDNGESIIGEINPITKSYFDKKFRVLKGSFNIALGTTGKYQDIQNAYEKDVIFKSISLEPDLFSFDDIIKLNSNAFFPYRDCYQTIYDTPEIDPYTGEVIKRNFYTGEIIEKIDTNTGKIYELDSYTGEFKFSGKYIDDPFDSSDFIIVNKFNEEVSENNEEYIVTVLGTGNGIRSQELGHTILKSEEDEIKFFKLNKNFESDIFSNDSADKIKYSKERIFWQYSGDINKDGTEAVVVDNYFSDLSNNVATIPVIYTDRTFKKYPASPAKTISFTTKNINDVISDINALKNGDKFEVKNIENLQIKNTFTEELINEPFDLEYAEIEVVKIPENKELLYSGISWLESSEFLLNVYTSKNKKFLKASYDIKASSYSVISIPSTQDEYTGNQENNNYTDIIDINWEISLKQGFERDPEISNPVYVDKDRSHNITVIVSKILNSTLESGKFIIEPVETFNGSIFKDEIDILTKRSLYIGNIINEQSNIISFYSRGRNYRNYNKDTDSILVEQTTPYRFAPINEGKINLKTDDKFDLRNIILQKDVGDAEFDMTNIIDEMLNKVKNNIRYTYRDVYDFGLTSILSYYSKNSSDGNYYFDPNKIVSSELSDVLFLNLNKWKRYVKRFTKHCQYDHKLSMFHADGPRKLLLNGNLSRCDDLKQDQESIVLTAKKIQAVSIKDNTYCDINIQWWNMNNEFTYETTWVPNSISLASCITYNDIINNIWNAPAGYRYGTVNGRIKPAFSPDYKTKDKLYLNCINYGVAWPDGRMTIEGQKTTCYEQTSLNRINVRRLLIYIERYVQTISTKYQYRQNSSAIRNNFRIEIESELERLSNLGALYNYKVICDSSNNPDSVIDNHELRVAIIVQPVQVLEFIVAQFMVAKTGTNINELTLS